MVDMNDISLDDIIKNNRKGGAGRKLDGNRQGGKGGGVLRDRNRGGVSKLAYCNKFNDYGVNKIRKGAGLTTGPSKLLVSNLDFGVSDSDMQELFSEFGALKSAAVRYDRSGRSLGTAVVVFDRKASAIKAMEQYNGVPLDGRALNIQLATSDINPIRKEKRGRLGSGAVRKKSVKGGSNRNQHSGEKGGMQRGGGGGGASGRGGARGRKPVPTAEQLDAELDAYLSERNKVE